MLNSSSLSHPAVQARILGAMHRARAYSLAGNAQPVYVRKSKLVNGRHDYFLRVNHYRGDSNAFEFYDHSGQVTATVLKSLRA